MRKKINPKHEARNSKQIQNSKVQNSKQKQAHELHEFSRMFFVCFFAHCLLKFVCNLWFVICDLPFGVWSFEFVSYFEFRISNLLSS